MAHENAPVATTPPTDRSSTPEARIAAVDIGSNSIRLVVAEASSARLYRLLTDEKASIALARGTGTDRRLRAEVMEAAAVAITSMVSVAQGLGAEQVRLVATAAVRDAPNRDDFIDLIRARTGLDTQILSGDDEARLAHESVAHAFDLSAARAAVLDIGGGSTELALSAGGVIERLISIPLGAVRLTDRFGPADRTDPLSNRAMYTFVRRTLREYIVRPSAQPQVLFGTGGTFTTLATIAIKRADAASGVTSSGDDSFAPSRVRGHEVSRAEVKHILQWLRTMDGQQRRAVPGLSADRAGIIIAGFTLVEGVMRRLGMNSIRVHDRGVRDGILLEMLRDRFEQPGHAGFPDRQQGVIDFGRRCRFEEAHSRHIARLALSIFDQLIAIEAPPADERPAWATPASRELLEASALLRDVGYFINYTDHHKHSYHLIVHSELPGFSPRELELIATIARYHRKARPKKKHAHYRSLSVDDRRIVRALAAILRIADGLDRTHTQSVDAVTLTRSDDRYSLLASSAKDISADIWGAQRKSDVFEREFGLPIQIEASEPTPP